MARVPKDPKEILPEMIDDYKKIFGNDLVSVILYGSAASGAYLSGKSDINVMVVLSESRIDDLDQAFGIIAKWKKRNVAVPLFLTEDYIRTSLDVFPIEYLNLQNNYHLAYGKDILAGLTFAPEFLRLQCEREIKGKLLLLREAFLETGGKGRELKRLVQHSLEAVVAIFNGLLYLRRIALPRQKRDVVKAVCGSFDMDSSLFERLLDIKEEKIKASGTENRELAKHYLQEMRKLSRLVDSLDKEI